ncbi:hypothetical protein GYMLUDRAFT_935538 [Collybiopsis luxurians FD-317 M1]|nr:hypothetical protein GYMLUDRAFT_935538 [Collybiopsis luxurians FD-317 M1]
MAKMNTSEPNTYAYDSSSMEISANPREGIFPVCRCACSSQLVSQRFKGIGTAFDVLKYASRMPGTRKTFRWRDVVKLHN